MSEIELIRYENPIRDAALDLLRQEAAEEHAAAVRLWGLEDVIRISPLVEALDTDDRCLDGRAITRLESETE